MGSQFLRSSLIAFLLLFCLEGELELRAQPTVNFRPQFEAFEIPGGEKANWVDQIAQDTLGFLWFGSSNGLHRWDGHHFKTYLHDPEDSTSVSSNRISSLFLDRGGRLWVGTQSAGLNLYDPHSENFTRFLPDPNDSTSLSHQKVNHIAEDLDGNLWIATISGLNFLKKGTAHFKQYLPDPNDPNTIGLKEIMGLLVDSKGRVWFSSWNSTLSRLEPRSGTLERFYGEDMAGGDQPKYGLLSLWETPQGKIWIGGGVGDVYSFDPEREQFDLFSSDPERKNSLSFKEGYINGTWVHSIMEDQRGHIWIGGHKGGIKHINPVSGEVQHFIADPKNIGQGPSSNLIWNLFQARDQSIWLAGGSESEVNRIILPDANYDLAWDTFFYEVFKDTPLYEELHISSAKEQWLGAMDMAYDEDDKTIWAEFVYNVQTNNETFSYAILASFNEYSGTIQFHHLKTISTALQSGNKNGGWKACGLAIGKDGKVWGNYLADETGIFSYDPQTGNTKNFIHIPGDSNSLMSNMVTALLLDAQGKVWVGQQDAGLSCLDPISGKWTHFRRNKNEPDQLGGNDPLVLMEGVDGRIWVGGAHLAEDRSFISVIDPSGNEVKTYWLSPDLFLYIRSLAQKDGKIYFGVQGNGLGILDPDTPDGAIQFFTKDDHNFPINTIGSMSFDDRGFLWMGSWENAKFVCFDPETEQWWVIENPLGHPTTGRRPVMAGPEGNLYFPMESKGWAEIEPDKMKSLFPVDPMPLRLTGFYVLGKEQNAEESEFLSEPIWIVDELELTHRARTFSFRFSAFQFQPPMVKYKYRLFPFETDWHAIEGDPKVQYQEVPPGNYQFQVKAYGKNGLTDQQGINLPVVILPPWWTTWWGIGLLIIAGLLVIAGIYSFIYYYQRRRWELQSQLQLEMERAEQLKELDNFKSRFYTNITHEFRTPLTVIKGMADQILEPEKIKPILQRNTERLLDMVNQLLALSKLETNSMPIHWIQTDIIPYLQYLTESCHSLAEKQKLNLAFFSREDQLVMDYDENKIQQILINLLTNAINFTPEYGNVKVIAGRTIYQDQEFLELMVQDTGKGIPNDKLPYIFDRFYQADDSSTRSGEGTGIGLALVKELVHLLDGEIKVDSEPNHGTKFEVYLPIHQNAELVENVLPVAVQITNVTTGTTDGEMTEIFSNEGDKPQILIIEDNADVRDYIISCLKQDYVMDTAPNGKAGLEKALEQIPDVVLCDIMMPEMDGFEVCQRLKTDRRTSHIPIILLTAKATQEDKVTGLSKGADAYLTKPFDKQELLVRLHNLAAQSQRLRERLSDPDAEKDQPSEIELMERAFLQNVHQIMENHLGNEDFDTNYLCREIAMSRAQLYRKLKALTGDSTANYIRSFRLKKAKGLLESTHLPVGEVASQVGYKDFSHFTRSFIKEFGIKPSEVKAH